MVRLISYNMSYSEGFKGSALGYLQIWRVFFSPAFHNYKIAHFLKAQKADIIAMIEVDTGSIRTRFRNTVKYMMQKLEFKDYIEFVKYPEHSAFKILHHIPIFRKQSNAIISKFKLTDIKRHELKEGMKRVVIEASVNCPRKITLLITHLALGKKVRRRQIRELALLVNSINGPVIVKGDFNAQPDSAEMRLLLAATGLKDSFVEKLGMKNTYPSSKPKRRLDYILTSKNILVKNYSILDCRFSDHLPVMIDFDIL